MENKFQKQAARMQHLKDTFVVFSQGTRLPFVTCDPETFNDQIWVFVEEEKAKKFAEQRQKEHQDFLMIAKLDNPQLLQFYSSLYTLGVNEIVFTEEDDETRLPLENLVHQPDYESVPEEKRPILNPQVQLTGIYFMQELHRKKPNNEKPKLHELEEEMVANIARSKFIFAIEIKGEENKDKTELKGSDIQIPCVKNKEGKMFQPIFTDPAEYAKFSRGRNFRASIVQFSDVEKILGNNIEGIVINPLSLNVIILKSRIAGLLEQFS